MEHSKLPWRVKPIKWFEKMKCGEDIQHIGYVIKDANEDLVDNENDNNFIVEACNNYERLKAEVNSWETNYNNLLAQYEEISAIAYSKSEEVERYKRAIEDMKARYGE